MFPYTVKYTESEYDIQKCQNTFDFFEKYENFEKICYIYIYKLHNSCFVHFVIVVNCMSLLDGFTDSQWKATLPKRLQHYTSHRSSTTLPLEEQQLQHVALSVRGKVLVWRLLRSLD